MRGWDLFLEAAFVMTVTVAAMLLADRLLFEIGIAAPHLSRADMVLATMAGALLLAAAFAAATLALRPTPPAQIAWRLDRASGGEERFLSALEIAATGDGGPFAVALAKDAIRVARQAEPARVLPRVPVGYRWGILLSLAGAGVLMAFPPQLYAAPAADFDADPLRGPAPLEVIFADASIGALDAFEWDFGDGHRSSGEEAVNVYERPGTYAARLRVTGPGGSSEKTRTIEVLPPDRASADFEPQPSKGRMPLEVRFKNRSRNAKRFEWDFGDGSKSTSPEPVHTYERPGVYTVRLAAANDLGSDVKVRERCVKVAHPDEPLADFRAVPREGEAPLAVQFEDQSSGAITEWRWDFGDLIGGRNRFSGETNPSYTYVVPGYYTVRLRVKGPHGEDEEEKLRFIHVRDARGGGKGGGGGGEGRDESASRPKPGPRRSGEGAGDRRGRDFGEKTARPDVKLDPELLPAQPGAMGELVEKTRVPVLPKGGTGTMEDLPYKEAYGAYRRVAEDSINRERIPPADRRAVRKYFESIRPNDLPR